MSTVILTSGAKPIFFSTNYFNRFADKQSDLVASTGNTLRHRLYDMDPKAQWTSAGSDDTTTETITAGLWLPGMQSARSIDYVAVLNHNIKEMKIEWSDDNGATYNGTPILDEAAITDSNTRVSLSSAVSPNKLKFTLEKTQTADEEKLIGLIIIALSTFQSEDRMVEFVPSPDRVGHKTAVMADKSIRRAWLFRSDASYHFNDFRIAFLVDDESDELARHQNLARGIDPFLFMPRPGNSKGKIHLVQVIPGTYQEPFAAKSTSGGRMVSYGVEEIGFE